MESEALSLIKSHASVTCKALQSRKDLGATEPQTPAPSPVPPWRSCLSPPSLAHELSLGGSQDSETPPCAPHLHSRYPMGWRTWGYVNGVSTVWVFISGCSALSGHVPDREGPLGTHAVLLTKGLSSILSFHEGAASSPAPGSAPSGAPRHGTCLPVWR